ncbi:MAG: hypothetical protein ABI716_03485, partial [Candidatus Saccharibacteria bacterium]
EIKTNTNMTQINSYPTPPAVDADSDSSNGWSEAKAVVAAISSEPAFLNQLKQVGLHPTDKTVTGYTDVLSRAAEDYCSADSRAATITQRQIDQIKLLANVSYFLHNQKEASYYEDKRRQRPLTEPERERYHGFKPYLVWFNQLVSDYAYTNPDASLSDMNAALLKQAVPSFPNEADIITHHIEQATRGARTEAASRQLLDRTELDYSPGTIDDDLHGGDLIVMRGGHRIKVDIKSSVSDIANIRGGFDRNETEIINYAIFKSNRDHHDRTKHVIVLFPGFSDADLGDSLGLHLPEFEMQKRADFITHELELAFGELGV